MGWSETQEIEHDWWGNCTNTYTEETKQQVYAEKMGIRRFHSNGVWYFSTPGKKVIDIGGGPVSILLKCFNVQGTIVDPFRYPKWIKERYLTAGITVKSIKAEDFVESGWDEVWMYNLLEHVEDPAKVVMNARHAGNILRVFDWLATEQRGSHRHVLSKSMLDDLYQAEGTVEILGANECFGSCYYGAFPQC